MSKDFLWCEKHRPRKVENAILPKKLKDVFLKIVKSG